MFTYLAVGLVISIILNILYIPATYLMSYLHQKSMKNRQKGLVKLKKARKECKALRQQIVELEQKHESLMGSHGRQRAIQRRREIDS